MPILQFPKDFQQVRKLPFCYLCGLDFAESDEFNRDHVPPKAAFNSRDRDPPLILKTHSACNSELSVDDKKVGQLIGLRRGEGPKSARDHALEFNNYPGLGVGLENLHVDGAVRRWVKGFHAALYREPLRGTMFAVQTPFPRADKRDGGVHIRPILQQDILAVEAIKTNRAQKNTDALFANNGKLRYECVWCQGDDDARWFCMFALDIYDWKDLGSHSREIPARGCVGTYALPDWTVPTGASINQGTRIIIPNFDKLDPFAP